MNQPEEGRLPEELETVAARLHAGRAQADPLKFDQIKQRVIARSAGTQRGFMRSRFATLGTVVALIAGTGGAIAVAAGGSSGGPQGGAANAQYCNSKKGCPPPKHNCGRHHNEACPGKPKRCYYTSHHHRHSYECAAGEKSHHKSKGKHGKSSHGKSNHGKSNHQKSSGTNSNGNSGSSNSKCTVRKQNGLTVLYCP